VLRSSGAKSDPRRESRAVYHAESGPIRNAKPAQSTIPKSGARFSEKIVLKQTWAMIRFRIMAWGGVLSIWR
jgi:hypothetical protein